VTSPDAAGFGRQVRSALAHLYDLVYLQTHPLAAALGLSTGEPGGSGGAEGAPRGLVGRALRQRLLDTIARLRPEAKAGEAPGAERAHRLLELRYVEALDPPAVQAQLGIGKSQYYREHARALAALVSMLSVGGIPGRTGTDAGGAAGAEHGSAGAGASWPATSSGRALRPLTSFVGRQREMADVVALLARHRLVTLTGPGGVGKTRLALEAAASAGHTYPDGVVLVELAALTDPALVPAAVARACGVLESGDRPPIDLLRAHFRGRRLLVVADNFEHLLPAGPVLAELLLDAPGLALLATSRAPLRLGAEQEYQVLPLELPAPPASAGAPPAADPLRADAVRLFVERARQARPEFAPDSEAAEAVAALCRRLDGLPLPIELAAARVRHASPSALLARLEPRLLLGVAGTRDAPARHRTLGAMLDWSHDLLSDGERRLFRRLGVFSGGWTLEAAEEVCAGTGLGSPNADMVFTLLSGLVDQSLVVVGQHGGLTRYRFLETVREYALGHLERSGEALVVRRRHQRWCRRLAEAWQSGFFAPGQATRLARLAPEMDNLRAALGWATQATGRGARRAVVDDGLRLAAALRWFWVGVGVVQEARERTIALLEVDRSTRAGESEDHDPMAVRARAGALGTAAHLAFVGGDFAEVEGRLRESVPLWRRAGDEGGLALALAYLGMAVRYRLDLDGAEPILAEARAVAARAGDRLARYWAAHGLALVRRARGDGPGAVVLDEEALALAESDGDPGHGPVSRILLASSLQVAGDLVRARRMLAESLGRADEFGAQLAVVPRLVGFATLAAREGQPERALRLAGAVAALRARTGAVFSAATAAFDPALATAARTLGEAAAAAALAQGQAMSVEQAVADALAGDPFAPARDPAVEPQAVGVLRSLTAREREVAVLVAGGRSNREIATALGISERTTETHVRHILAKLGGASRRHIAALAGAEAEGAGVR
jgi:non-specific serine/threonine protein kinase